MKSPTLAIFDGFIFFCVPQPGDKPVISSKLLMRMVSEDGKSWVDFVSDRELPVGMALELQSAVAKGSAEAEFIQNARMAVK